MADFKIAIHSHELINPSGRCDHFLTAFDVHYVFQNRLDYR